MKVEQLGLERVVDIQFGTENCYHLMVEMYDRGNIVLVDKDYRVVQMVRGVVFDGDDKVAVGHIYPKHRIA